jgi:hypothetical protein
MRWDSQEAVTRLTPPHPKGYPRTRLIRPQEMAMDEYEADLRRQLADLQQVYRDLAKPIIDRLVRLESLKPAPPIVNLWAQLSEAEKQAINKAIADMQCFGTGVTYVESGGEIQHVPFADWSAPQRGD